MWWNSVFGLWYITRVWRQYHVRFFRTSAYNLNTLSTDRNWEDLSNNAETVFDHISIQIFKNITLSPRIFNSLLGVWNYTRLKSVQNNYVRYFVVFKKCAFNLKTLSSDRNFTGKATATQLTNTSCKCQWLQDTFALIQLSVMLGTVSEWKFMEPNVGYYLYTFLLSHANFWI